MKAHGAKMSCVTDSPGGHSDTAVKLDGDQRRMISPLVALVGEGVDGKPLGFRKVGDSHHGFLVEIGFSLTVQEHLLSLSLSEIVEVGLQALWPIRIVLEVFSFNGLGLPSPDVVHLHEDAGVDGDILLIGDEAVWEGSAGS